MQTVEGLFCLFNGQHPVSSLNKISRMFLCRGLLERPACLLSLTLGVLTREA